MSRDSFLYCKENIPSSKINQAFVLRLRASGHPLASHILRRGGVPSVSADTRWRPWAAVPPQSWRRKEQRTQRFPKGHLFLSLLLSHARKGSPGFPGAEWDEQRNGGEVSVPSQFLPETGFCEHGCGGRVEDFLVLGCGWVASLILFTLIYFILIFILMGITLRSPWTHIKSIKIEMKVSTDELIYLATNAGRTS